MPRKHFVKSHLKDTRELESFPQVPHGRVRSSRWPSLVSLLGIGGRRSTSHSQGHFGHIHQMLKMPFPGVESPHPKLPMKRPKDKGTGAEKSEPRSGQKQKLFQSNLQREKHPSI